MAKNKNKKDSIRWYKKVLIFFRNDKVLFSIGIILFALAIFLTAAMISFLISGGNDYNLLHSTLSEITADNKGFDNLAGASGAKIANLLINSLFGIASLIIPFYIFSLSFKIVNQNLKYSSITRFFKCSFIMIWLSVFIGVLPESITHLDYLLLAGNHGNEIANILSTIIGNVGLVLCLIALLLIYAIVSFVTAYDKMSNAVKYPWLSKLLAKNKKNDALEQTEDTELTENQNQTDVEGLDDDSEFVIVDEASENTAESTDNDSDNIETSLESDDLEIEIKSPTNDELVDETIIESTETQATQTEKPAETVSAEGEKPNEVAFEVKSPADTAAQLVEQFGVYDPTADLPNYKIPTYDLLNVIDNKNEVDIKEQNENKNLIIESLKSYGIFIKRIEATVGPTITLYEIVPVEGTRISKIKNLGDDIAMILSAPGIRIIAPMPGKGTIGIEVPNKKAQIVSMHSVVASKKFQETKYSLPVVLGKTITNDVYMFDLCKLPHLLVAGATGQGKSVGLNAIIASLLYKKHPSELKFVLVDPKKVEFSVYSTIEKHFLAKLPDNEEAIITDVNKVIQTLQSLCKEMDDRYDILKKAKVRNIIEYNERFINRRLNPENGHRFLPYIVVIIDEFGDLIMTAGKEVELPIARIAQLARAVGIHMIIATQRPSTNIITGIIKANFPARMAFKASSMIDSRTILDAPGANLLIGRGDMLFLQGSETTRVQCAFVDTPEVEEICEYIGNQQAPYTVFALPDPPLGDNGGDTSMKGVDMSKRDAMFEEVARMVVLNQTGSTSNIQRKFSIGFNRAGRIMDQLEAAGIVGANDGSKGRQVLVQDEVQLERIFDTLS